MTADKLIMIAGAVLSLVFSYFPFLNTWYGGLNQNFQRLIMIAVLALTAAGVFGVTCLGFAPWLGLEGLSCDLDGALALLVLFFEAVIANQSTYALTLKTRAVKAANAAR
jgi:hypothetical protein